jgi:hypothetical protein
VQDAWNLNGSWRRWPVARRQPVRLFTLSGVGGCLRLRYEASGPSPLAARPGLRSQRFDARRGPLVFILAFVAASLIASFAIGAICDLLSLPGRTDMDKFGPWELLFFGVIFAPLTETLFLQMLPVGIVRRFFRAGGGYSFLVASVPFALTHAGAGLSTVLAAGIPCGAFLGLAYVSLPDQGRGRAFLIVLIIHALHNLPACLLMIAGS